jgi:RNA polymerase sigma-70 factor (ECF subfamily)
MGQFEMRFPTTQWTLVIRAESRDSPEAREALAQLCGAYWQPLYVFVRMKGHGVEDAQDLVQGFFARFLSKDYLTVVDREKGRFRSYLLGALNHYMSDEWDRAHAAKRGGGVPDLPMDLDFEAVERQSSLRAPSTMRPERAYDRKWALALLDRVVQRLRDEYAQAGQSDRYERLIPFVTGDGTPMSFRHAGELLGISEGAARVAAHRLKHRYKEAVREEVAATVSGERETEEELRYLLSVLSG